MKQIVYLDIETQFLFQDFPGGQKNRDNIKKIRLAVAGTLWNGIYSTFEEKDIDQLIAYLHNADLIVGHGLHDFDYKVLASYFQFPEAILGTRDTGIIHNTFDTKLEFSHILNKIYPKKVGWVKLDDIATRNFNMGKPHEGILVPQMWREGKHEDVISYLLNDLKMTEAFYMAGCAGTNIKYDHKTYSEKTNTQVSQGEKEIFLKW